MLRYFYDCEFLEDGRTIDLISIGIVTDDGREYYAVNSDMPIARIHDHDWLVRNVVPSLPLRLYTSLRTYLAHPRNLYPKPSFDIDLDMTDPRVKPHWVIANEVREFLLADGSDRDSRELWAWYGAYDHVALCQLWGPMHRLPEGIPMYTRGLKQECDRLGNPALPEQAEGEHNALADARHNRTRARHLDELNTGGTA